MLQSFVSGVLRLVVATIVLFFSCPTAMAQEITIEGSGEGSGQVTLFEGSGEGSGDIAVASERVSATVWWVPAPLGDPDPDETALTAAVAEAVMVCPRQIIRCRGKASGGDEENHEVDGDLARGRENACIEMVIEAGGVAYGAAPGDWLNGREGDHGVLVQCAVSQDGVADLSPFGEGGAVSDATMTPSSDDGRLDDLSARVDQLEAVMPMLCQTDADCGRGLVCADNGQCVDEANPNGASDIRLFVRTGYQHRRTANGFIGDLGLTFDLGPATVEGGVSLGAMTAVFEDDRAHMGQTVGGFAVLTVDAGDTVSIGPGFRYEENVGTFINGDDISAYQRFVPSLRFNFSFGEEKTGDVWADLLYERSVDAGALAPNGVGFSAGIGWDVRNWCQVGFGATIVPETTRW